MPAAHGRVDPGLDDQRPVGRARRPCTRRRRPAAARAPRRPRRAARSARAPAGAGPHRPVRRARRTRARPCRPRSGCWAPRRTPARRGRRRAASAWVLRGEDRDDRLRGAADLRGHRLSWAGLWARIRMSARSATSRLLSASPPSSRASAAARPEPESEHSTGSPHPRASAEAMLPEPMKPTCMAGEYRGRRPRVAGAGRQGEPLARGERACGPAAVEGAVGHRDGAAVDGARGPRGDEARFAPALPVSVIARLAGARRGRRPACRSP